MNLRVLVADDQELVRTGLSMILDAQPGIEVVSQVDNGRDAVEQALRLRPDVCLLDIRMPQLNGIEATRALAGPDVAEPMAVVVITTFDLDEYVHGALRAGAAGFFSRTPVPNYWRKLSTQLPGATLSSLQVSPPGCWRALLRRAQPNRSCRSNR